MTVSSTATKTRCSEREDLVSNDVVVVDPPEKQAPKAKKESTARKSRTKTQKKTTAKKRNSRLTAQAEHAKTLRRAVEIRRNVKPITPEVLYDTGETPVVGAVTQPALTVLQGVMHRADTPDARERFQRGLKLSDSQMQAVVEARAAFAERLNQAVREAQERENRARFVPLVARQTTCEQVADHAVATKGADFPEGTHTSQSVERGPLQDAGVPTSSMASEGTTRDTALCATAQVPQSKMSDASHVRFVCLGVMVLILILVIATWMSFVTVYPSGQVARCLATVDVQAVKQGVRARLALQSVNEVLHQMQSFDTKLANALRELTVASGCVVINAPAVLALPSIEMDFTDRAVELYLQDLNQGAQLP